MVSPPDLPGNTEKTSSHSNDDKLLHPSVIMENCISHYAKARLAQCVTQPLATEPDAPGIKLANVLESQIV